MFTLLIELSVLYKEKSVETEYKSYLKFRTELVRQLCQTAQTPRSYSGLVVPRARKTPRHNPPGRLVGGFLLTTWNVYRPLRARKDCRLCRLKGVRKEHHICVQNVACFLNYTLLRIKPHGDSTDLSFVVYIRLQNQSYV